MCATTKYVSVTCQSNGKAARKIPERPPIVKTPTAPSANSIAVSRIRLPRQVVAIQLKILIPVGTAIAIDESMKKMFSAVGSLTENMWDAQTSAEKNPIATVETAIALQPKIGVS